MSRGIRKPDNATVSVEAVYESAYNKIVQPTSYVSLSHYFVANWLSQISESGLKILVALRKEGFYNPKAGVNRGDIDMDQKCLAVICGLSVRTVQRAFESDKVLGKYVERQFLQERNKSGHITKEHYIYRVKMDDVLTDEDSEKIEKHITATESEPIRQKVVSDTEPKRQNDVSDGQKVTPTRQIDASTRQKVAPYNVTLTPNTKENTLNTAAPSGVSTSSSSEQEYSDKEAAKWTLSQKAFIDAAILSYGHRRVLDELQRRYRAAQKRRGTNSVTLDTMRTIIKSVTEQATQEAS